MISFFVIGFCVCIGLSFSLVYSYVYNIELVYVR
jgi:hypothetical protein